MPTTRKAFEVLMGKVPLWCRATTTMTRCGPTVTTQKGTTGKLVPEDAGMTYAGSLGNFRAVFGADTPLFKDQPWYVAWNGGGADSA
jgi:hypothetical protein